MKVYISTDIEGVSGIVAWEQVLGSTPEYAYGRGLLMDEVNAAIDGASEAGALSFVVNDSHAQMHNILPQNLAEDFILTGMPYLQRLCTAIHLTLLQ